MRDIDWLTNDKDEDLVWVFWDLAQNYVVKRWGDLSDRVREVDISDLQVLATEALMKFAKRFLDLEVEMEGYKARRSMFWHFLKQEIDQDALNLIHRRRGQYPNTFLMRTGEDGDLFETEEVIRTQLRAPQDISLLKDHLADAVARFEPAEQFTLALRFYEQMPVHEIAAVLKIGETPVGERIRHASLRVLNAALRLVESTPPDELQPPAPRFLHHMENADAWTQERYGCDLAAYLEHAHRMYKLDVSPLQEALERANGTFTSINRQRQTDPRFNVRNGLAMQDEQVREIRRRLAAGETGKAISEALGVARPTISMIKNGKSYAYVD